MHYDFFTPTKFKLKSACHFYVCAMFKLVQNMIQKNHELLIKQNNELSEMMSELSVNVADINDRVVSIEKKFLSMDAKVEINRVNLLEVTDRINEMQNSLKCIKNKQTVSVRRNTLCQTISMKGDYN